MNPALILRPAGLEDVPKIHALLHNYALANILLDRSEADITYYLCNFTVAYSGAGEFLGCTAVRDFGNNLLEIRSLAVQPELRRGGVGRALVESAIARLRQERPAFRLFALTLQPGFFERLGFQIVTKDLFPEKIWADCSKCSKVNCCDEVAVIYQVGGFTA